MNPLLKLDFLNCILSSHQPWSPDGKHTNHFTPFRIFNMVLFSVWLSAQIFMQEAWRAEKVFLFLKPWRRWPPREVLNIIFSTATGITHTNPHLCLRGLCRHSSWWALLWKYHPGPGSRRPCKGCYGAPSHPPPDTKNKTHRDSCGYPLTNNWCHRFTFKARHKYYRVHFTLCFFTTCSCYKFTHTMKFCCSGDQEYMTGTEATALRVFRGMTCLGNSEKPLSTVHCTAQQR